MNNPQTTKPLSQPRVFRMTAVSVGAAVLCALWMPASSGSSALATPPWHGTRSTPYPPAFCAYMEVRFGEYWMHTVQERIVRRAFLEWSQKQREKLKPGDGKR